MTSKNSSTKSPSFNTQLTHYSWRLRRNAFSHRTSAIAAILLVSLQLAYNWLPVLHINASSTNDLVLGGLDSKDPRAALLAVYDQDKDSAGNTGYQALYANLGITRSDLANTKLTTVKADDPNLVAFNRNNTFAQDQPVDLPTAPPPTGQPVTPAGCRLQINVNSSIQPGAQGECVLFVQRLLNDQGYMVPEDGKFGPSTEQALKTYQLKNGLSQTGLIDFPTWARLNEIEIQNAIATAGSPYQTLYIRPLALWNAGTQVSKYDALYGTTKDGRLFYVLVGCGNPVMATTDLPPLPSTPPPPPTTVPPPPAVTPPPVVTVPTPPAVTPPITPTPQSLQPNIEKSKSVTYLTRSAGALGDANSTTASAGDTLEYTLVAKNSGGATQTDFVVSEQVTDVLEYADIVNLGGSTLAAGMLTWPKENINAGASVSHSFSVKIKNPIPTTPVSKSDPKSFDLQMDNVYGNQVSVKITPPVIKKIETALRQLPDTGPNTGIALGSFLATLSLYFYLRNRQLMNQIRTLSLPN